MSFLEDLYKERQQLATVLSNPEYAGIRGIVEELYPDRAHFIFELLQNAEDAGATEAHFLLNEASLTFEHNGRPFTEEDVRGITNIGKGTKKDQDDQIGRFGVGFKAVFAYSETPKVWSPHFSFKISELVLPTAIETDAQLGQQTRFEFQFNNPKKPAEAAFQEVKAGLEELAETTLLFLSNLKCIGWRIGEDVGTQLIRILHSENQIEVAKKIKGRSSLSSHFLRFSDLVPNTDSQQVAVAFALDFLPNATAFDGTQALAKQMKIVSANPGRVAVYFAAEKETSGLRFHLHAPFVPELSRASIKETPMNDPLFAQLAKLAASSLYSIRDFDLLNADFLGVLPNPQDTIPVRYQAIRQAVIKEMNTRPLTPTHSKSHAPARDLLQAKASLKELLSSEDIKFVCPSIGSTPQWALAASQRNSNADRFLSALEIKEWDVDKFIETLCQNLSEGRRVLQVSPWIADGPDDRFVAWLTRKPLEWHQQLYALIRSDLPLTPAHRRKQALDRMRLLRIVRLSGGRYSVGGKCYFPGGGVQHDAAFPRVAAATYSSGKNKTQQEEARKFLEEIGVREVGEAEQVQAILQQRYTSKAFKPDINDLERFIALVEKDSQRANLFNEYHIFKQANEKWGMPSQLFLDSPFLETGISAYYDALGEDAGRKPLSNSYLKSNIPLARIVSFATKVGVEARLRIKKVSCRDNPAAQEFVWNAPGGWSATYGVDQDFTVERLTEVLESDNESLSRLVWNTACEIKDGRGLVAKYRNNSNQLVREYPSQLVCILRDSSWIPQGDGRFVRPADALRDLLPKGFPYDEGCEWLTKVRFGQDARKRSDEYKKQQSTAKELGFSDEEALERARGFAALPIADQERILVEFRSKGHAELPEHEPSHPERRANRVAERAATAPARTSETRMRSVSVGIADVKQETEAYLREQYTNADGEMICQVCKDALPFRLPDGSFYFEKVEFLSELERHHHQNYLALCPNHGAMFQYAHGSRDQMKEMFLDLETNELSVVLAQAQMTIYFTKTHIADLKTVIALDGDSTKDGAMSSAVSLHS